MNDKQGNNIGHRYIELYVKTYGEFLEFKESQSQSQHRLAKYINSDNKHRALVMRGLPFKVIVDQIIDFFRNFCQLNPEDIIIEELMCGKRTGTALVFFPNH